jgi:hypothetical protein
MSRGIGSGLFHSRRSKPSRSATAIDPGPCTRCRSSRTTRVAGTGSGGRQQTSPPPLPRGPRPTPTHRLDDVRRARLAGPGRRNLPSPLRVAGLRNGRPAGPPRPRLPRVIRPQPVGAGVGQSDAS